MKKFRKVMSLLVALCLIFTAVSVCVSAEDKTEVRLGDVNCDGNISINDVALILKYIAEWDLSDYDFSFENADVNRDGKVNVFDAIYMLKCVALGVTVE